MVSKNQIKLITSLQHKKFRIEHQLFIAEGVKVIQELLQSNFVLEHLFVTERIFEKVATSKMTLIKEQEMQKITALHSPSSCLAIFNTNSAKSVCDLNSKVLTSFPSLVIHSIILVFTV
jgi:TrmH family RNA methyltransferase